MDESTHLEVVLLLDLLAGGPGRLVLKARVHGEILVSLGHILVRTLVPRVIVIVVFEV